MQLLLDVLYRILFTSWIEDKNEWGFKGGELDAVAVGV